ncbi:hypothetical protein SipoB123_26025 [Streptomyces ipomoeae]|nr:hypothetical protein SipoB123_26025 [Streptomyces ipomoeae]
MRRPSRNSPDREKVLTTQVGDLDLAIPKARTGSFFPSLLERRRRTGQALRTVIVEARTRCPPAAWTTWSRPWAVTPGTPKSEVSRICGALDTELSVGGTR